MSDIEMSKLFKSEFMVDGATVYNLKDSMWLGKPSKSNEWCFGVQNTDATDNERKKAAKFIAHAINTHHAMQARIDELEGVISGIISSPHTKLTKGVLLEVSQVDIDAAIKALEK